MNRPSARKANSSAIRPYPLARMVAATTLLVVILVAVTCYMLFPSYQETLEQEKSNLRNLSIAFAAQTFSAAQAVDKAMRQAEQSLAATAPGAPGATPVTNLGANSVGQEYLLGIHKYDLDGKLVASAALAGGGTAARPSPAELRAALAAAPGELRIGISNIDPATGRGVLNFSRPAFDAAGARTGTIVAQAASERFERIYSLVELGKGGSVTLFNRDGTMLVRGPSFPSE